MMKIINKFYLRLTNILVFEVWVFFDVKKIMRSLGIELAPLRTNFAQPFFPSSKTY